MQLVVTEVDCKQKVQTLI